MRFADAEVRFVSGVGQPFGFDWIDARRSAVLTGYGNRALLANPFRYFKIVAESSWEYVKNPAGSRMWLQSGLARLSDLQLSVSLASLEWPQAVLVSASGVQRVLSDRRLLLLAALAAVATSARDTRPKLLLICAPFLLWSTALLFLIPDSRYLLMPMCLIVALFGLGWVGAFRFVTRFTASLMRFARLEFTSRTGGK
jgi:hypothetical protein